MMAAPDVRPPLSNMQLELLKLYAAGVPEEYLAEIKEMIARFLLAKAREAAGKTWQEKNYSDETADKWLKGEKP